MPQRTRAAAVLWRRPAWDGPGDRVTLAVWPHSTALGHGGPASRLCSATTSLHDPRYLPRLRCKNTGADLVAHPGSESWDSALGRPIGGDSPGAPPWSGDGKCSFWAIRLRCPVQGQPVSLGGTCELPLLRLEAPKAPRNYGNYRGKERFPANILPRQSRWWKILQTKNKTKKFS